MNDDIGNASVIAFAAGKRMGEQMQVEQAIQSWETYASDLQAQLNRAKNEIALQDISITSLKNRIEIYKSAYEDLQVNAREILDDLDAKNRAISEMKVVSRKHELALKEQADLVAVLKKDKADAESSRCSFEKKLDRLQSHAVGLVKVLQAGGGRLSRKLAYDIDQTLKIKKYSGSIVGSYYLSGGKDVKHFPCWEYANKLRWQVWYFKRDFAYWFKLGKVRRIVTLTEVQAFVWRKS